MFKGWIGLFVIVSVLGLPGCTHALKSVVEIPVQINSNTEAADAAIIEAFILDEMATTSQK